MNLVDGVLAHLQLAGSEGATVDDLSAEFPFARSSIRGALYGLRQRGHVEQFEPSPRRDAWGNYSPNLWRVTNVLRDAMPDGET